MSAARLRSLLPLVRHPIVGAPMAFVSGAELATAVSRAGGLGFIAAGYDMPRLDAELHRVRSLLGQTSEPGNAPDGTMPIGVGLIAWAAAKSQDERERLLAGVLAHRPCAVWIFAPDKPGTDGFRQWVETIRRVSDRSTSARPVIFGQVGSVREALEAVKAEVDVIVAQGIDAGGHGSKSGAGVITLVPEVRDALTQNGHPTTPLLAAGGVMDGRGLASVLALGADGAVMGTRLLLAEEANVMPAYRKAILDAADGGQSTLRTRLFDDLRGTTGWPAAYDGRALYNESVSDWERIQTSTSGSNEHLVQELKQAYQHAVEERDYKRLVTWAGTGVGLAREVKPAAAIVEEVVKDCRNVIRQLQEKRI